MNFFCHVYLPYFRRSSVLELVNTMNECGATSVFTMLVSLHLFFIGSSIRTGFPGFNNFNSLVPRVY